MSRPTIDHLLDHTARLWRPTETLGTLKSKVTTYVADADLVPCAVQRPTAVMTDIGPGLASSGERTIYFRATETLAPLVVVELVTGPDTGNWEIDGPPTSLRGHHIQTRCRAFNGQLEAVS